VGEVFTITDVILELLKPLRRGVTELQAGAQVDREIAAISENGSAEKRYKPTPAEQRLFNALRSVDVALDKLFVEEPEADFWRIFAQATRRRDRNAAAALLSGVIYDAVICSLRVKEKPRQLRSAHGERIVLNSRMICAARAHSLVSRLSKNPPTGTAEGPYRSITSLLYSVISGCEQDMKRDCDKWLRFVRHKSLK
jgi:hypothetical protein